MIAFLSCIAIVVAAVVILVVARARYHARLGAGGPVPEAVYWPLVFSLASVILLGVPA